MAPTEITSEKILRWMEARPDRHGEPISKKVAEPEDRGEGWFRFRWLGFSEEALPKTSDNGACEWCVAWHGCKMESIYSIMYHSRLLASKSEEDGGRTKQGCAAIYVHKDGARRKAEGYSRWTPLFEDNNLWMPLLELKVDRGRKANLGKTGKTDQWAQAPGSVQLVALWMRGMKLDDMILGSQVSEVWNPLMEANPGHLKEEEFI